MQLERRRALNTIGAGGLNSRLRLAVVLKTPRRGPLGIPGSCWNFCQGLAVKQRKHLLPQKRLGAVQRLDENVDVIGDGTPCRLIRRQVTPASQFIDLLEDRAREGAVFRRVYCVSFGHLFDFPFVRGIG
jgi:hypothetical protein